MLNQKMGFTETVICLAVSVSAMLLVACGMVGMMYGLLQFFIWAYK